jgi:hypothetical protein
MPHRKERPSGSQHHTHSAGTAVSLQGGLGQSRRPLFAVFWGTCSLAAAPLGAGTQEKAVDWLYHYVFFFLNKNALNLM